MTEKNVCKKPKIGILIVAYNAVTTLTKVFDRLPANVVEEIEEIVVFDDASQDDTYVLAHGYKTLNKFTKLHIFKNPKNLGYGGNQKLAYKYFIKKDFDVVVLLHGDGQYAPEIIRSIYEPIINGKADAVFGSRMKKDYGGALKGGMPRYKYIGNRILTAFENNMLDMELTEFHSGYRAYSCHALSKISFETCTDDFHFDTEIIVKLNHCKYRIIEVPIPTYYGNEICYVNGTRYAFNVVRTVLNYKLSIYGYKKIPTYMEFFETYPLREHNYSSHNLIMHFVGKNKSILDLGCGSGYLAGILRKSNKYICGVDIEKNSSNVRNCDEFHQIDLDKENCLKDINISKFDVVLCADIIEHLRNPGFMLSEIREKLNPNAKVVLSVPNVANIIVRFSLLFGRFNYSDSGIMDNGHVKFYTFSSIQELVKKQGFKILKTRATPLPFALFFPSFSKNFSFRVIEYLYFELTNIFKRLFSYQFVFVLVSKEYSKR